MAGGLKQPRWGRVRTGTGDGAPELVKEIGGVIGFGVFLPAPGGGSKRDAGSVSQHGHLCTNH